MPTKSSVSRRLANPEYVEVAIETVCKELPLNRTRNIRRKLLNVRSIAHGAELDARYVHYEADALASRTPRERSCCGQRLSFAKDLRTVPGQFAPWILPEAAFNIERHRPCDILDSGMKTHTADFLLPHPDFKFELHATSG